MTQAGVSGKRAVIWLLGSIVLFAGVTALIIRLAASDTRSSKQKPLRPGTLKHPPDFWWQQQVPCPPGAALKTSTAPTRRWCETNDGTKHGFYTRWYTRDVRAERGTYDMGKRTGLWTTWHRNGKPASHVGYVDGKQRTDKVEWNQAGELKKASGPEAP